MRVALCQINPTVGDLAGNSLKILQGAERARAEGADLAVFPELALVGYPPRDLLDRPAFLRAVTASLHELVGRLPRELACLVGFVESAPASDRPGLFNAVALVRGGCIEAVGRKRLLPTYDVFDDQRFFAEGERSLLFTLGKSRVGVPICEDIWADRSALRVPRYAVNPVSDLVTEGADLLINVSASPFTLHKREGRAQMLSEVARAHQLPVVFVNQVGANDDVLFDGQSAVFHPSGRLIARARAFEEDFLVASVESGGPIAEVPESDEAAALEALAMGTRDYVHKTGFSSVLLGLSGGIDSALTAAIAVRALGPEHVLGVALPTRYSSEHSREDAAELASQLGIRFREISIEALFQSYLAELPPHLDALGEAKPGDVTYENIQARIRGNVLMALSNRLGSLLLTTGNKSEVAVGYCTLYGDMAGALAVIADAPKTFVYAMSREFNRQAGRSVIPESTLTKAPSAELRPNQTDQDSLPPYDVLDAILELHVEDHESADEIIARGYDADTVKRIVRLVRLNEYKRRQMAPGLILTRKAFGSGRRYPIAQRFGV
ncbi:MAG: NAD+ synthase [Myxococcales bacterium]